MISTLKKKSQLVTKDHFDKSIKTLRQDMDKKMNVRFDEYDKKMNVRFDEYDKKMDVRFDEYDKKMDVRFDESYKVMDKKFDAIQEYLRFRLDPIEQVQKDNEEFKQSVLKSLDWLVGAFKKFEEEHTILSGKYSGVQEKIEDHEQRIVRIECIT